MATKFTPKVIIFKIKLNNDEQSSQIQELLYNLYKDDCITKETDEALYVIWKPAFNFTFDKIKQRFGTLITNVEIYKVDTDANIPTTIALFERFDIHGDCIQCNHEESD